MAYFDSVKFIVPAAASLVVGWFIYERTHLMMKAQAPPTSLSTTFSKNIDQECGDLPTSTCSTASKGSAFDTSSKTTSRPSCFRNFMKHS
uniref:Secreted protein n=1 Tax=Rhabditophanes sp. KR3021 TaxID=114890 RepID=A0AC35UDY4_9BILA